jgi:alpha-glucosidase
MTPFPEWSQQGVVLRAHGGIDAIEAVVAEAETAGVPVSAVWVEDWCGQRQTSLGTRMLWNWDVDREKYPEWEEMVATLRDKNIRVLAYLNPYLVDASDREGITRHLYAEAVEQEFLVKNDDGSIFWMDQGGFEAALIDLTNPAARDWMQAVIEALIDTGVSGWMADFAEGLPLDVVLHEGVPERAHNQWPALWADINRNALESKEVWADSLVFHRSGNARSPGAARSFWLGDQLTTWDAYDGLATVIPGLLSSGLSGYTMQHSDTGGYLSVSALGITRDAELFKRWVELSAFTPLFRMHSTNQPEANHQWNTEPATQLHLAKMVEVYASLAPYRQGLMLEAEEQGLPVIRPLFLVYPNDEKAWTLTDQFLLGSDVLVAPVMTPNTNMRTVYVPEGEWIHGVSGQMIMGPQEVSVEAPLGEPAVFVRAGSDVETPLRQVLSQP